MCRGVGRLGNLDDHHPLAGLPGRPVVSATSSCDDPAAELHEDAWARLREHLTLPGCPILRRSSPASSLSGYQDPACWHEEGAVANHRERLVLGALRRGSAAEYLFTACREIPVAEAIRLSVTG